ncbi:MAG: branched-chain amino acid ABC transporter permease [Bauldia sp.]
MTAPATGMARIATQKSRPALIALAFLVALLAAYPFWAGGYQVGVLRDALIFGILALSLDFLWGKAGVLSFGHAAFFGIGAYGVAILGPDIGNGNAFIVSLAAGVAVAGMVAGAVGYFLLYGGVRGPYLTIVTLALALVAQRLATGWANVTGGDAGLLGAPPPGLAIGGWSVALVDPVSQYALVAIVLLVSLLGVWLWCRGRRGNILQAIQDHELKLRSLGYDTAGRLLAIFILSAMLAAVAGGLYAGVSGFVAPDLVGLLLSTQVIVWVAVGGRGTLVGPLIGAVVVIRLQSEISSISLSLWPILIGAFFIALVFLFPEGLLPFATRGVSRLFRRSAAQ